MVLSLERDFEPNLTQAWMHRNWTLGLAASVVYVLFVFIGKHVMKNRPPLELRNILIVWNAALAVFSITGVSRMWPDMVQSVQRHGFHGSTCHVDGYYNGVTGFWLWLFTLSKLWEFGDTVFLVLRKRPVIFLHWYHHITTLLYTWYAYQYHTVAATRWGIFMNYSVHAFMYTYYTLRAASVKVPHWVSMGITTMQIVQMAIGSYVTATVGAHVLLGWGTDEACRECPTDVALFQLIMYLSYLVLFCNFFVQAYVRGRKQKQPAATITTKKTH